MISVPCLCVMIAGVIARVKSMALNSVIAREIKSVIAMVVNSVIARVIKEG